MQRYRWPGYEIQLLGELQRQQNNAQFCDTLLQTEGISVPTHSCILAALSPYLSQKLSASPSPPSGQKRQLQLQAVKAQTLLKLVGLLYSGEVEVKGSIEQNDVLSAARQFGITDLVEGQKDGWMKEGKPKKKSLGSCRDKDEEGRRRNESRKLQDAQVQAEMAGRRATDPSNEKRSCVSTGTQTVKAGEKTAGSSLTQSGQTKPPAREPASSVAQSLDFSITLQPQNITLDKHFYSSCFPPIASAAPSDGESTLDRSSDSLTIPTSTSAWPSDVRSFPIYLNDDSNSMTPREDSSYQQSSQFEDRIGTGLEGEKTNARTADKTGNIEQPSHCNGDEIEEGNSTEKTRACANVGMKMMEATQISIKVKLRRRTKGEVWEVVSMQDADETLSVLTSLKQDGSNHRRPQTGLASTQPSYVQPSAIHKSETPILQPAITNSPGPPAHPNTTLHSQCFTPNQNDGLESVPVPQPPGPVEESDEQIQKLLEDIMMGLNILPNLERDCKKSHHLQPSLGRAPDICQAPVAENDRAQSQMHAAVSAAGCVYYQDFGTQIGHPSTETAQNQPSCSSLLFVQPDALLVQKQQLQRSPQYHSSVTSMGQKDGTSHQGMPQSKSQNCPCPQAPTAFYSSGQKLHYPACQEPSSQDYQNILQFLPLTNSLPCMDDLRLPQCLSPLEPFASAAKYQPVLSNSTSHSDTIQPQPSLHGRPWLTENPGTLQFPLSAVTHRKSKEVCLSQDTNHSCWSKRRQKHLDLNPQNRGTRAGSSTVKKGEEFTVKYDHRKMEETLKCQQGDTNGAAPKRRKRKCTSHPPDAACSLLTCTNVKVSDGTKRQRNLSACSVSLSSNNVLVKEREMATSTSNIPNKFLWKPDEPSTFTEGQREKTRGAGDLSTDQTRIRTRAFLKKTQETPSNTSLDNFSVLQPMARRARIVNKHRVSSPMRKCGMPPKAKLEESPPAISDKQSHGVESEQQIDKNLPKEEEEGEKTKIRCEKWKRNQSEAEVIPLKKTTSAESTGKAETDDNNDIIPAKKKLETPKRPRMVTLKEFQKVIKRQHSKTRKSKDSQDKQTGETARDVESEVKACGRRCEELIKETEMNIAQPQKRDGIEESHVIFSVDTVDKNHNQIFHKSTAEYSSSQRDDTNSCTSEETSLFGDGCHPLFSFGVLGEEMAKLAAEREQPLKNPDQARKARDARVSDITQQTAIDVEGSSNSDTHMPPQEDKMPLDRQVRERTGPPLSHAVEFIKSSGCDQEEEEEVEVDVLLYSPDKVPQSRECDSGVDNMDITQEEEEEEDVTEIDVTGDEAE